jgi:hypothetical protein
LPTEDVPLSNIWVAVTFELGSIEHDAPPLAAQPTAARREASQLREADVRQHRR